MSTVVTARTEFWLDASNIIHVRTIEKDGLIIEFAINYCTKLDGWRSVYRVDNHHGFAHEQQLWRDKKPIPLAPHEELHPIGAFIIHIITRIKENHKKYRQWYIDAHAK